MDLHTMAIHYMAHGYDKNGINWHDAVDRATEAINTMSNVEFLSLIGTMVEDRLDAFALSLEKDK